jgi:hypothetical protein
VPSQLLSAAEQLSVFTYIATARASDSEAKQTNTKFNRHHRTHNSNNVGFVAMPQNGGGVYGGMMHNAGWGDDTLRPFNASATISAVPRLDWTELGKEVAADVQRWTKEEQKVSFTLLSVVVV